MTWPPPRQRGWRTRPLLTWLGWVGVLLVVALGASATGQGAVSPPALTDPASWTAWASARTPLEAAFAVLGLMVVALAWYLLAVTTLAGAARLWGSRRLISVVDVLTLPVVRRGLNTGLGIGLVGSSVAGVAAGGGWETPVRSVVIVAEPVAATVLAEPVPEGDPTSGETGAGGERPVMRLLPDEPPDEPSPTPTSPTGEQSEWEVRPGDHLWSLAVEVLRTAGGDAPSDGEVTTYWRRLIEANRDRLVDPANPDLIFPGQVLVLPSPSASASEPGLP